MYYLNSDGSRQGLEKGLQSPIQWFFLPIRYCLPLYSESWVPFGLKNRRYFAHIFHDECARSLRRGEVLTLLFLDIDHFKDINDTHGHHIGDIVLNELGSYIMHQCRPCDTAVRWGGEEFIIL